jgi:hypothetical protein
LRKTLVAGKPDQKQNILAQRRRRLERILGLLILSHVEHSQSARRLAVNVEAVIVLFFPAVAKIPPDAAKSPGIYVIS